MSKHIVFVAFGIFQSYLAFGQADPNPKNAPSRWTKKEAKEYINHYYSSHEADLICRIKRVRREESNSFIVTIKSCGSFTAPCTRPSSWTKSKHQLIIKDGGEYQYSLPLSR